MAAASQLENIENLIVDVMNNIVFTLGDIEDFLQLDHQLPVLLRHFVLKELLAGIDALPTQ